MSIQHLTGHTLGQYELRELLGVGGMGAVYRAHQTNLKRDVALKVMSADLAEQPGYLERFTREAETSAALDHPNIITIYDYGIQQGISYLVSGSVVRNNAGAILLSWQLVSVEDGMILDADNVHIVTGAEADSIANVGSRIASAMLETRRDST